MRPVGRRAGPAASDSVLVQALAVDRRDVERACAARARSTTTVPGVRSGWSWIASVRASTLPPTELAVDRDHHVAGLHAAGRAGLATTVDAG